MASRRNYEIRGWNVEGIYLDGPLVTLRLSGRDARPLSQIIRVLFTSLRAGIGKIAFSIDIATSN